MKAFIIDRYGKEEVGRIAQVPEPELRYGDVLIQIHAASVNALDSKIRSGEFKLILPYRMPLILGNDAAGTVARVGSRVTRFKPGDEVYTRPDQDRIGTFAELIALQAWRDVAPVGEYVFHAVADDLFLDPAAAEEAVDAERCRTRVAAAQRWEATPMSTREVGNVFRRAATHAGLDPDLHWLSGHLARVGAAQDMVRAGSTTAQVQIAGRWASERMPIRYAEHLRAAQAGEDRFARLKSLRQPRARHLPDDES